MKRRKFFGSLFAAGAVVKEPTFWVSSNDKPGSNEVVTKWATLAVKPKSIPVYWKPDIRFVVNGEDLEKALKRSGEALNNFNTCSTIQQSS